MVVENDREEHGEELACEGEGDEGERAKVVECLKDEELAEGICDTVLEEGGEDGGVCSEQGEGGGEGGRVGGDEEGEEEEGEGEEEREDGEGEHHLLAGERGVCCEERVLGGVGEPVEEEVDEEVEETEGRVVLGVIWRRGLVHEDKDAEGDGEDDKVLVESEFPAVEEGVDEDGGDELA